MNLPESTNIVSAQVAVVSFTVPADILTSGVVIEVSGVEARVRILQSTGNDDRQSSQSSSAKGPASNSRGHRPRKTTPPVYDPGGGLQTGRYDLLDESLLKPDQAVQNLAQSFLQAESQESRAEFQAAIEPQLHAKLQSSTSSVLSEEELDVGMGQGHALPTFIASYLARMTDRLHVYVNAVSILVELGGLQKLESSSQLDGDAFKSWHFLLKISNLSLQPIDQMKGADGAGAIARNISIGGIDCLLLTDRSNESATAIKSVALDMSPEDAVLNSPTTSAIHQASVPRDGSVSSIASSLSEDSSLMSENLGRRRLSPLSFRNLHPSPDEDASDDERSCYGSQQDPLGRNSGFSANVSSQHLDQDLTQSRIFTHDEAESMYASAMGSERPSSYATGQMPGGWKWPEVKEADSTSSNVAEQREGSPTSMSADSRENLYTSPNTLPPTGKQLLSIDRFSIHLPVASDVSSVLSSSQQAQSTTQARGQVETQAQAGMNITPTGEHNRASFIDAVTEMNADKEAHSEALPFRNRSGILIDVTNLQCQIDMQVGKTLLEFSPSLVESLRGGKPSNPSLSTPSASPAMSLKLDIARFTLVEHISAQSLGDIAAHDRNTTEEPLFRASLEGLLYERSTRVADLSQHIQITKIELSHAKGPFLLFGRHSSMRAPLKDSLALQQQDVDLAISFDNPPNKIDVHAKPITLRIELSQLDDILSKSGGLSNLMELGSSIASSNTIRSTGAHDDKRGKPAPGVRFTELPEPKISRADDQGLSVGKVNLRIDGLYFDIIGSECSLKANTSAVKVVQRAEGIGLQIDHIVLEGPCFLNHVQPSGLCANFHSTRLEYAPLPTDHDLDRLLSILTPTKDKYGTEDDILVGTLLRQRRKGGVLRLTVSSLTTSVDGLSHMAFLKTFGSELSRLSSVTKYLPEDDRPGILCLGLVKAVHLSFHAGGSLGKLELNAQRLEGVHVSIPSLMAAHISTIAIERSQNERLLGAAVPYASVPTLPSAIMCRFIADEMDPTIRIKIFNLCTEYHASFATALQDYIATLDSDKAEIGHNVSSQSSTSPILPSSREGAVDLVRKAHVSVDIRDSAVALTPREVDAKAVFLLSHATLSSPLNDQHGIRVFSEITQASLMLGEVSIKTETASEPPKLDGPPQRGDHGKRLSGAGFVIIGYVSSIASSLKIEQDAIGGEFSSEATLERALLILESCADSTQTLGKLLGGLSPPPVPVEKSRFRTEIMPIENLLASFTGDAFVSDGGPDTGLRASGLAGSGFSMADDSTVDSLSGSDRGEPDDVSEDEKYDEESMVDSDHDVAIGDDDDNILDSEHLSSSIESDMEASGMSLSIAPVSMTESVMEASRHEDLTNSLLDFRDDHFGPSPRTKGPRRLAKSSPGSTSLGGKKQIVEAPVKVRVRDVHIIWNLYDGYDWQKTRDIISHAVQDVESKAAAQRTPKGLSTNTADEEREAIIGDFLFNSVYIGIPANRDPRELAAEINQDIDNQTSETGSYATYSTRQGSPADRTSFDHRKRKKRLKLQRSSRHKITFELKRVGADIIVFPPNCGEVQNSIDLRVGDLEIFDHIPTSTWKTFATYMRDAGEREADTSMIHLEILNVKPVPDLAASETVLKITVLPLRLHIDQDAIDFMSRFFEFKDESAPASAPTTATPLFLQRVEVNPIKLRLDFKPKRVDYGGLRSGRTTEFMNFFVLDQADMILRRVILYGVSGLDRLGIMLNNIWTPDVKENQLPGILAGLAPIRSLVNVGSGVKDLVVVPMREYRKDGRIVRSIQKGALSFAKTTSKELLGLGAKLALGTQTVLQSAETALAPATSDESSLQAFGSSAGTIRTDKDRVDADDDGDNDEPLAEPHKKISLYADQPVGVVQGLRGAYSSLERDLLLAKDAVIAVPGEAMASGSAKGAAKAVLKQAPTVILRPAIGASKAVGQTLLGAGNTLDRENWRRMNEVSWAPISGLLLACVALHVALDALFLIHAKSSLILFSLHRLLQSDGVVLAFREGFRMASAVHILCTHYADR